MLFMYYKGNPTKKIEIYQRFFLLNKNIYTVITHCTFIIPSHFYIKHAIY